MSDNFYFPVLHIKTRLLADMRPTLGVYVHIQQRFHRYLFVGRLDLGISVPSNSGPSYSVYEMYINII